MNPDKRIMVCSSCMTASCWYGEFMCLDSREVGTLVVTVRELKQLGREHPDNWTDAKLKAIYGTAHPNFSCEAV